MLYHLSGAYPMVGPRLIPKTISDSQAQMSNWILTLRHRIPSDAQSTIGKILQRRFAKCSCLIRPCCF